MSQLRNANATSRAIGSWGVSLVLQRGRVVDPYVYGLAVLVEYVDFVRQSAFDSDVVQSDAVDSHADPVELKSEVGIGLHSLREILLELLAAVNRARIVVNKLR